MSDPFTLNKLERDTVVNALEERIDGLNRYLGWVDARPNLPERQVAMDHIRNNVSDARRLAYRLKTGREL